MSLSDLNLFLLLAVLPDPNLSSRIEGVPRHLQLAIKNIFFSTLLDLFLFHQTFSFVPLSGYSSLFLLSLRYCWGDASFPFTLFSKSFFLFLWSWNHSGYFWHYPFSCLSLCFLWFVSNTAAKYPSQHLVLSFLYLPYQIQAFHFQLQNSTPLTCTYIWGFSLADGVVQVLHSKCPVSESFSEHHYFDTFILFFCLE